MLDLYLKVLRVKLIQLLLFLFHIENSRGYEFSADVGPDIVQLYGLLALELVLELDKFLLVFHLDGRCDCLYKCVKELLSVHYHGFSEVTNLEY